MNIDDLIYEFIGASFIIAASMISLGLYMKRRSKLLASFFVAWLTMAMYVLFTAISDLFESPLIARISDSMFPTLSLVFFLVFLDYAQNDQVSPKKMAFGFFVFAMIFTWVWYPANEILYINGTRFYSFYDIYYQVQNVCLAALAFIIVYWFIITARSLPPSLVKLRPYLYIGSVFGLMASVPVFVANVFTDLVIFSFIGTVGIAFISTLAIRKEPRLVHLLPFKVYRLIISSKGGCLYYERQWCDIDVDSVMIAGMMSAINSFSKGALREKTDDDNLKDPSLKTGEKFDAGAIYEMRLKKAVILSEMQYAPVNILLLSSKASKDLKVSLEDFSASFMQEFKSELYTKDGFAIEVTMADIDWVFGQEKIDRITNKFFSNISSFI